MKAPIWISALTAFVVAGGGSVGVALVATKGSALDLTVWILAGVVGAVAAAKDVRSQYQLPPVDSNAAAAGNTTTPPKP